MKRAVLVVFSIIAFLISIPAIFTGILLTAWGTGGDSTLQSDPWRTASPGYAIVSDSVDLAWDSDVADWFEPTIGVENQDASKPVFVGIGPTQDVDQYLSGVAQTIVYRLGDDVSVNRDVEIPGSAVPEPPADQGFWLQQASGTGMQELRLDALSGSYRFVAMNADGSAPVAIAVQGSFDLPFLVPAGIAALVFGGLMLMLALLLLILGIRAKPSPAGPPSQHGPYGGPPQGQPYPGTPGQAAGGPQPMYPGQMPAPGPQWPQAPGPQAPQAPGPQAPQTPQAPQGPQAPQTPQAPQGPQAPEGPQGPPPNWNPPEEPPSGPRPGNS